MFSFSPRRGIRRRRQSGRRTCTTCAPPRARPQAAPLAEPPHPPTHPPRQVLKDVGIPFPPDRIVGTDDPGPGIAADKANPGMRVARMLGVPSAQVMHTDNSFKYNAQFIAVGGYGLYPTPTSQAAPIQDPEFEFMLKAASAC